MERNEIFIRLTKILVTQLHQELRSEDKVITVKTTFVDDLGMDSLDHVEFIMGAEEEFDIEIPDDDAGACLTVGAAVDLVARLVGADMADKPTKEEAEKATAWMLACWRQLIIWLGLEGRARP